MKDAPAGLGQRSGGPRRTSQDKLRSSGADHPRPTRRGDEPDRLAETVSGETVRCAWATSGAPEMGPYHDREWGVPVHDDRKHFEFLVLEGAQAGLSWATILQRRNGYRAAFADFDPVQVARFSPSREQRLLRDPAIIRNRRKIASVARNARAFLAVQEEFGSFDAYAWGFVGGAPRQNRWRKVGEVPATSPESDAFSRDLKRRGFSFVGSTIIYAHMQAVGMVNDHLVGCFRHAQVRALAP